MSWNRPNSSISSRRKAAEQERLRIRKYFYFVFLFLVSGIVLLILTSGGGKESKAEKPMATRQIAQKTPMSGRKSKANSISMFPTCEATDKLDVLVGPAPTLIPSARQKADFNLYTNRVFTTTTEQFLSFVFTTEPGDPPFPIPPLDEEEKKNLVGVLISPSRIDANDAPKIAAAKEAVNAAKKEMLKFLKEGGDPDQFLDYYNKELNRMFEWRQEAEEQIREVYAEDPELGKEFLDKVNAKFETEGIKKLQEEMFVHSMSE